MEMGNIHFRTDWDCSSDWGKVTADVSPVWVICLHYPPGQVEARRHSLLSARDIAINNQVTNCVQDTRRRENEAHTRGLTNFEISVGYNQGPGPPVCLGSNFSVVSPTSRSTYLTPVGPSPHPPHLCTAAPARYETIENNKAREQNISQVRVSGKGEGQFLCV